jgi:malic enzyme
VAATAVESTAAVVAEEAAIMAVVGAAAADFIAQATPAASLGAAVVAAARPTPSARPRACICGKGGKTLTLTGSSSFPGNSR